MQKRGQVPERVRNMILLTVRLILKCGMKIMRHPIFGVLLCVRAGRIPNLRMKGLPCCQNLDAITFRS